jgi:azurin
MKFDITEFTVKPGEQIELVFENPDAMQHNVVIVKPNAREKVGLAADKMLNDPKGAEKNYVPAMTEVLFSTPLIDPGQRFVLRFKAPTQTGDYPFICTFPAHWRLMGGMMKVK